MMIGSCSNYRREGRVYPEKEILSLSAGSLACIWLWGFVVIAFAHLVISAYAEPFSSLVISEPSNQDSSSGVQQATGLEQIRYFEKYGVRIDFSTPVPKDKFDSGFSRKMEAWVKLIADADIPPGHLVVDPRDGFLRFKVGATSYLVSSEGLFEDQGEDRDLGGGVARLKLINSGESAYLLLENGASKFQIIFGASLDEIYRELIYKNGFVAADISTNQEGLKIVTYFDQTGSPVVEAPEDLYAPTDVQREAFFFDELGKIDHKRLESLSDQQVRDLLESKITAGSSDLENEIALASLCAARGLDDGPEGLAVMRKIIARFPELVVQNPNTLDRYFYQSELLEEAAYSMATHRLVSLLKDPAYSDAVKMAITKASARRVSNLRLATTLLMADLYNAQSPQDSLKGEDTLNKQARSLLNDRSLIYWSDVRESMLKILSNSQTANEPSIIAEYRKYLSAHQSLFEEFRVENNSSARFDTKLIPLSRLEQLNVLVARNLYKRGVSVNEASVLQAVADIQKQRDSLQTLLVFRNKPLYHLANISTLEQELGGATESNKTLEKLKKNGEENTFATPHLQAALEAEQPVKYHRFFESTGNTESNPLSFKEAFLAGVVSESAAATFLLEGHGLPAGFYISGGQTTAENQVGDPSPDAVMITPQEFAAALAKRKRVAESVNDPDIVIVGSCYSGDFIQQVVNTIKVPYPIIFVSSTECGQPDYLVLGDSIGTAFLAQKLGLKKQRSSRIKVGDLFENTTGVFTDATVIFYSPANSSESAPQINYVY